MKKIKEEKVVVSKIVSNDGEITNEIYEGDRIIRKETIDYFNETIEIGKGEKFYKVWECAKVELDDELLTGSQWRLLNMMGHYIQYQTCLLTFSNGVPLTLEHISQIMNMPERTTFRAIEGLVKKKIIGKFKIGHEIKYYMNPFIYMKGKRVNKTLISMFGKSKWAQLHEESID